MQKAIGLALSLAMLASPALAGEGVHWSYEGLEGPAHWGELSADYAACATGREQSPIDLTGAISADLGDIELQWNSAADWEVVNNGHTIQVDAADAGYAVIEGKRYDLVQFHFHAPSEHVIDGVRSAMEAHFVYRAQDGDLAVIAAMIEGGGEGGLLDAIMAKAPKGHGEARLGRGDPAALLPVSSVILRYQGSLTTPPCSEIVLWTMMKNPLMVSDSAIAAFTSIYSANARPLQALHRRFILAE